MLQRRLSIGTHREVALESTLRKTEIACALVFRAPHRAEVLGGIGFRDRAHSHQNTDEAIRPRPSFTHSPHVFSRLWLPLFAS